MSPITSPDPFEQGVEAVFTRASREWAALRGASVFMTGGTGLFGRWLLASALHANRRLALGMKLCVLTRDPATFAVRAPRITNDPAVTLHAGDVKDFVFPSFRPTHVIHAATTSAHETFRGEDPLRKFDTLVAGTRRTLDFAARGGVRRFLFVSSGVAYGVVPAGMQLIPEDYLGAPDTLDVLSALGQAKRTAEFLSASYADRHGWELSVGRCFSFVGPVLPLDLHYAIGNFIRQALFEPTITVCGDGAPVRSYLYMADLVVWLLALLTRGPSGRLFNVGSDRETSIADLAHVVRDVVAPGKVVEIRGRPSSSVGNPVRDRYVPRIDRARTELGLDVWTDLRTAIGLTASYAAQTQGEV